MRFIGSKEQLLPFIERTFKKHIKTKGKYVGDLFCGTGAVSRLFKRLDHHVIANDSLKFCYLLAHSSLAINREPQFRNLIKSGELPKEMKGDLFSSTYDRVLTYLNDVPGEERFIFKEYSPGGTSGHKFQRCYFTDINAKKIDAIRSKILTWQDASLISSAESSLLLSDLMRATNRIANIAGTYGCFIKHWDPRSKNELTLLRSEIIPSERRHQAFCKDAIDLASKQTFDVLYLDPPYTWRHYGAYYHILETIAEGDEPTVQGRTGLRPWQRNKSRFCDRSDASNALHELISSVQCEHLFLSYNTDGLISNEQIMEILSLRGTPVLSETSYRRYRSNNSLPQHQETLKERLYYVRIN